MRRSPMILLLPVLPLLPVLLLAPGAVRAGEEEGPPSIAELARRLSSDDLGIRQHAAWDLWLRRKEAEPAAASIAAAIRDPDEYVRNTAARTLEGMLGYTPDAVPELAKGLADERVEVRRLAARLLPWCRDAVVAARKPLIAALTDDPDAGVRAQAANALRMLPREEAGPAGPTLRHAVEDPSPEVRAHAVYALGWLGLPDSLSAAIELLDDPSPVVRVRALQCLQPRQDLPDSLAETAADLLLDDPDPEVRRRAAFLAGRFPRRHEVLVPALLAAVLDDEYPIRVAAAVSLGAMGPVDPSIPKTLGSALGVGFDPLTAAAAESLTMMGPIASAYLPDLGRALPGVEDENCRNAVVDAIGKILEPVLREAVGALDADSADLRDIASLRSAAVLVRIRRRDPESLARLVDTLPDERNGVGAMYFLADLGPLAYPAIPHLEQLARGNGAGAVRADLVLARLGAAGSEEAFARLLAVLGKPGDPRRIHVARGLFTYLPGRPEVLSPLLKILEEDGIPSDLRAAVVQAVGAIGPAAKAALPALKAAERDPDRAVSASARTAMTRITSDSGPRPGEEMGGD